jgi:hypothetical protein
MRILHYCYLPKNIKNQITAGKLEKKYGVPFIPVLHFRSTFIKAYQYYLNREKPA